MVHYTENVEFYDINVGMYSKLNECMVIYMY